MRFLERKHTIFKKSFEMSTRLKDVDIQVIVRSGNDWFGYQSENWVEYSMPPDVIISGPGDFMTHNQALQKSGTSPDSIRAQQTRRPSTPPCHSPRPIMQWDRTSTDTFSAHTISPPKPISHTPNAAPMPAPSMASSAFDMPDYFLDATLQSLPTPASSPPRAADARIADIGSVDALQSSRNDGAAGSPFAPGDHSALSTPRKRPRSSAFPELEIQGFGQSWHWQGNNFLLGEDTPAEKKRAFVKKEGRESDEEQALLLQTVPVFQPSLLSPLRCAPPSSPQGPGRSSVQ
ncbi:uncharacterized protein PAC_05601 [Phialocephala subalpina]|uniref:MADS-box domain-containing protein n=1 Tax=Phialocephala subalpina TaxID=576137 RepID=A0A1L7WSI3_9HELO|nr:uncharacterized protein PAC_05601 [Phialocephala subalpina]